jgi:hypothetical protein
MTTPETKRPPFHFGQDEAAKRDMPWIHDDDG